MKYGDREILLKYEDKCVVALKCFIRPFTIEEV